MHTRSCLLLAAVICGGCAVATTTTTTTGTTSETARAEERATVPSTPAAPAAADPAADLIAERSVRSHMAFLASDALNGRGSGTRDEWIAAEYLASQLQAAGVDPIAPGQPYVEKVQVERSETAAPPIVRVGTNRYTHGKEAFVQALGAAAVSGPLQKFSPGTPPGPGEVVLMPETPPRDYQSQIAAAGAVLLLETPQARRRWSSPRLPSLPARLAGVTPPAGARPTTVFLARAAYEAVSAAAPGTTVAIEADVRPSSRTQTWNAVGQLAGSDPSAASEVILLSAHLDHVGNRAPRSGGATGDTIYNGADDDASGSVAVLELARAFANGPRPKRTIVFAFFGSEESGGHGSRYFAERPVVPLSRIVANLQFEMIGRPDSKVPPRALWLTGYERSTLGPALAKQGAPLVQDPHPEENFFTRSDNIRFARLGVVAHTVSSFGLHQEYHQPSDEIQHIDFAHMTEAIRSMLAPIRWLADSGFRPEWLPGGRPR